jgi:hypothetical protein
MKCSKFYCGPDEQMGIVRYNWTSNKSPLTEPFVFPRLCADEPYKMLNPKVEWTVGNASNIGKQISPQAIAKGY